jgi:hypothetical protein
MPIVDVTLSTDAEVLDFLGDREVWFGAPMTAAAYDVARMRRCFEVLRHEHGWLVWKWAAGVDPRRIMHDPLGMLIETWDAANLGTTYVARTHQADGEAYDYLEDIRELDKPPFNGRLISAPELDAWDAARAAERAAKLAEQWEAAAAVLAATQAATAEAVAPAVMLG